MNHVWNILIPIASAGCLLASIRLAITGSLFDAPDSFFARIAGHPIWFIFLLLIIPSQIGYYGRSEMSPIPWTAFKEMHNRHGLYEALFHLVNLATVYLWMLWIPAQIWIKNGEDRDHTKRVMARLINLLVGLILMTPANPIYSILNSLGQLSASLNDGCGILIPYVGCSNY